jgi:hypothetical protein
MVTDGVLAGGNIELVWDACDRAAWERHLAACGRSSLEQSWAYGEAVAACSRRLVRRGLAFCDGRPVALVQVFEAGAGRPLTLAQAVRGPLWLGPVDAALRLVVCRALKQRYLLRRRRLLLWMPELPEGPDSEALMRRCGLRRMVTGHSTIWLDLGLTEAELRRGLRGNWRSMLSAAEAGGLELRCGGAQLDWLLDAHDAFRRRARFLGPSGAFVRALAAAAPDSLLVLCAYAGGRPVAGVLAAMHGCSATYYLGVTTPDGRRLRAHNLLLWNALLALKARDVAWLDLGGVDARTPGVARFKLGLGGELCTLSGSYL